MIISDLEYLESADNSEIQGGKCYYANTNADDDALAFGDDTNPFTDTFDLTDAKVGGFGDDIRTRGRR